MGGSSTSSGRPTLEVPALFLMETLSSCQTAPVSRHRSGKFLQRRGLSRVNKAIGQSGDHAIRQSANQTARQTTRGPFWPVEKSRLLAALFNDGKPLSRPATSIGIGVKSPCPAKRQKLRDVLR